MSKQLLIYENIQPLSDRHRQWAVDVDSYDFATHLNSSPLLATEIPFAAAEYPIIFSPTATEGDFLPLAVMGLKEGQNLFIDEAGKFSARYIPAFIRRYPFVLAGAQNADNFSVCIDENSKACVPDGSRGKALFESNGEQSPHLKEVIAFLKDYQLRAELSKVFCKKLYELNLLEPMQASITFKDNEASNMNLTGFYVVKREKLKSLSDADALDFFKKDGLELIYSHMQSLTNFNSLISKMSSKNKAS